MAVEQTVLSAAITLLPQLINAIKDLVNARQGKKMETQDINNFNAKISKIEENLRTINDGTKNIAFRLTAYSGLFFNASRLQTSA
ncbi:MAG: hypothetical protein ACREBU_17650, partial [Nitrososphaera sp.]